MDLLACLASEVNQVQSYLLNKADVFSEPVEVQLVNGTAIQLDGSGLGVIPPFDQTNNSTLTRTTLTLIAS